MVEHVWRSHAVIMVAPADALMIVAVGCAEHQPFLLKFLDPCRPSLHVFQNAERCGVQAGDDAAIADVDDLPAEGLEHPVPLRAVGNARSCTALEMAGSTFLAICLKVSASLAS